MKTVTGAGGSRRMLLLGGKLFDGIQDAYSEDQAVLIENGTISAVGRRTDFGSQTGVEHLDCSDAWILPGLINVHVHLTFMYLTGPVENLRVRSHTEEALHAARIARVLLAQGITTARDMGGRFGIPIEIRDSLARGKLVGPELLVCGLPLSITGGHAWFMSLECDGADSFRRGARSQLKAGADFIKFMASHDPWKPRPNGEFTRPELSEGEIRATIDEAHAWGRPAGCHVMGSEMISRVLEAGVDIVEHGQYLTHQQARLMAEQGIYFTPTLSSYDVQTMHPRFERGEAWGREHAKLLPGHASAVRNAVDAGVSMLVGTDSVGVYWEEVGLLREHGVSPAETLRSCTSTAARALHLADRIGTIEAGKQADLVVLNHDPMLDARALRDVRLVLKAGLAYTPGDLVASEHLEAENLWELARYD
jgi:imidazolonepropionase-like amidohydrolase